MNTYYPLRFEPIYRDILWGGDRIKTKYGRVSDLSRIAESWEISDRKEEMSVVLNGPLKGQTLHQLL